VQLCQRDPPDPESAPIQRPPPLIVWRLQKSKIDLSETRGRAAGEVERTALAEQLKAAGIQGSALQTRLNTAEDGAKKLQTDLDNVNRESAQLAERTTRLPALEETNRQLAKTRDDLTKEQAKLLATIASLTADLENERKQTRDKLALLTTAREELTNQFKVLANDILDENSKKFTVQNQTNLNQLLDPLGVKIIEFRKRVEEVYVNEGKDRSALTEQVKALTLLNNTLSQDAKDLTLALKGDRKSQGNWGEIILDDVLQKAGLLPDQHYTRQGSVKTEDGQTHVIPDVVINLPGDRHLVVDSKFTLPDYRLFADADNDEERAAALKRYLASIRAHMKGLSEKKYQTLYGLTSLDFVIMFVPLEPAFMLAVTNDRELFHNGWEKNVLLVSPSTLLFVVRTVAYLWRQEDLSRNAKEISNRGAELYDKLVGFVDDLQRVGERIKQAQQSYDEARRKFSDGTGNVIRQAQMLKTLGVKPTKRLPAQWVEDASIEPPPILTTESASTHETEAQSQEDAKDSRTDDRQNKEP